MLTHKDIIIRAISSFIFIGFSLFILAPILMKFLKSKMPGQYTQENNLDTLIRRQKERLRSQYGLSGELQPSELPSRHSTIEESQITKNLKIQNNDLETSPEIKQIFIESRWGGSAFSKEIQSEISKKYSYTIAESKILSFLLLCEKRHYFQSLSKVHQSSTVALKNFLISLLLFLISLDEIKEKNFSLIDKIAKKMALKPSELALAFQIKILMAVSLQKELKEERIFTETLVLTKYSDETIKSAFEYIVFRESNLWAVSSSQIFEELSLSLNYASLLSPFPIITNKKDIEVAQMILGISLDQPVDEIKKAYKKIALVMHPDKIVSQKLPKTIEKKSILKFNQIQEAYEILMTHKK